MKTDTKSTGWQLLAMFLLAVGLSWLNPSQAKKVDMVVDLGNPVLMEGAPRKTHLKVGLTGFDLKRRDRSGINLSLVLDRSGSMSGQKLERAKQAARMVVDMLGPNDVFSLVMYDDNVDVLIPATKLDDPGQARRRIDSIQAGGSTALFAGVSKGLAEVRKFHNRDRVNRVVLLSDGLANVGPSSPNELARLGRSAGKEGIAVTTIGLGTGYNEDLMTRLAQASDGNHAFVENAADLAAIFEAELEDVLSVVAQDVIIHIHLAPGVRPLRVVDREGDIRGQDVSLNLNQLYSGQEKFVLLEVEVPQGSVGDNRQVASVDVAYRNMVTNEQDKLSSSTKVSYTKSKTIVKEKANKKVLFEAVKSEANLLRQQAIQMRDEGDLQGAGAALDKAASGISSFGSEYNVPAAAPAAIEYFQDSVEVKDDKVDWNRSRKSMKAKEYQQKNQSKY